MTIDDFINVQETQDVPDVAELLFQRKYQRSVPEFPHHVVAFHRADEGVLRPVCYVHFTDCGDILLGGGACTDERVLRQMTWTERESLRAAGGIYRHALQWSVRHFAPRFSAIFGYCGDALAERVDRAVGFESTSHDHLLVYWTGDADAKRRRQMIAKAHAFGAF
jgi:hypothetical protein